MKKKHKKWLLFDIDNTLSNDYVNTKHAFFQVLKFVGIYPTDERFDIFHKIDNETWRLLDLNQLPVPKYFLKYVKGKSEYNSNQLYARVSRFEKYFEDIFDTDVLIECNDVYFKSIEEYVVEIEGAKKVLVELSKKGYNIAAITNGPGTACSIKLASVGIIDNFQYIFSADKLDSKKPSLEYFNKILKIINASKDECIIIGDSLTSDVKGGNDNNIDVIWFNQDNKSLGEYHVKHIISNLYELQDFL